MRRARVVRLPLSHILASPGITDWPASSYDVWAHDVIEERNRQNRSQRACQHSRAGVGAHPDGRKRTAEPGSDISRIGYVCLSTSRFDKALLTTTTQDAVKEGCDAGGHCVPNRRTLLWSAIGARHRPSNYGGGRYGGAFAQPSGRFCVGGVREDFDRHTYPGFDIPGV